jgi:thiopurine S-methyltransferase
VSEPDAEYWHSRWREGRIGFHQGAPNAYLVRHGDRLGAPPRRIFVPLCGKAEDLAYLAGLGHAVVGAELSPIAAEAFFSEHGLRPERSRRGPFEVLSVSGVEILVGDVFALLPEHLGPVDAAFDRAALVAIAPSEQPRYAAHVLGLLPAGAHTLLVTFDYDTRRMQGPPFAVPHRTVHALYGGQCDLTLLEERDVLDESPKFREAGVDRVTEAAWLLTRRGADTPRPPPPRP